MVCPIGKITLTVIWSFTLTWHFPTKGSLLLNVSVRWACQSNSIRTLELAVFLAIGGAFTSEAVARFKRRRIPWRSCSHGIRLRGETRNCGWRCPIPRKCGKHSVSCTVDRSLPFISSFISLLEQTSLKLVHIWKNKIKPERAKVSFLLCFCQSQRKHWVYFDDLDEGKFQENGRTRSLRQRSCFTTVNLFKMETIEGITARRIKL